MLFGWKMRNTTDFYARKKNTYTLFSSHNFTRNVHKMIANNRDISLFSYITWLNLLEIIHQIRRNVGCVRLYHGWNLCGAWQLVIFQCLTFPLIILKFFIKCTHISMFYSIYHWPTNLHTVCVLSDVERNSKTICTFFLFSELVVVSATKTWFESNMTRR